MHGAPKVASCSLRGRTRAKTCTRPLPAAAAAADENQPPKKKSKKAKKVTDLSEEEKNQMEKLKNNIITKKAEMKAEGVSGGQINKDAEIVEWVNKLNALKEKEAQLKGELSAKDAKLAAKEKKGDEKEISRLRDEIDAYKLKLKEEFGYSKQDINKDPDLVEMQQRFKEMGGK